MYQFNKGDERAFKKLFDDFFKSSCAFVKRYIPDHGAVEDVVQETFINLWEKRGIYTDMVYFKAYLYKSLYNNALFYLRQHKISEDVDPGIEDNTETALAAIIEEEVHREIIAAIDRLPSERRRIVELSMAGHTQEENVVALPLTIGLITAFLSGGQNTKKEGVCLFTGRIAAFICFFLSSVASLMLLIDRDLLLEGG